MNDKTFSDQDIPIGTVVSDQETPTFETIRIKLKSGQDVKPGMLVRIPVSRTENSTLIGRIRSAYEHNPNEAPEDIAVRDTLVIKANYPQEEDSTTIYRLVEADLIEEIIIVKKEEKEEIVIRSPQNLPNSGVQVFIANVDEVVQTLGIEKDESHGLYIGETVSGATTQIILKREAIQRHMFICGTTGSGKSYAMGVITEELRKHELPIIFIDTQDEYSVLAKKLGGKVVDPGKNFKIHVSSLTESEFLDLLPEATPPLQLDVAAKAFGDLQTDFINRKISNFTLEEVLQEIPQAAKALSSKPGDESRLEDAVKRKVQTLNSYKIFGKGVANANDWCRLMYPCLAIRCKQLTSMQLQSIATAVLRELQNLRLRNVIPPYVAVIDEAHLFVPQGEGSPCKQIIREGVRIGRHHGICIILLTQSPVDIDKSVIRQCNTRFVFALEADQLDAIRGVKSDASEEMLRGLPKMPRGTCLISGTYESFKHTIPVKIRTRHTKDSEGGESPDIFKEMKHEWVNEIAELKRSI